MTTDSLASVALGSLTLYGLIAIVARSVLQRMRTGSTGWRGVHGRPGSAEWWAGVAMAASIVGFFALPLPSMLGVGEAVSWMRVIAGAVLVGAGSLLTVIAQLQMGDAWRIGVRAGERTELRTAGLFAWCRNPIFTAMLLTTLGMVVWVPLTAVAWLALWAGLRLQVRVVEEPHLLHVHGDRYRDYAARTGRFMPGVGRGVV